MLTALSLAEKLGPRGLVAVSVHPGVIRTNLSKHLDWKKEYAEMSKSHHYGNYASQVGFW